MPRRGSDTPDGLREMPAQTGKPGAKPHYHGHRERLKDRFRKAGAQGIADYELLELILSFSIRQGDVKPRAKALIARFGSVAETLTAPREALLEVDGIGESTADAFAVIRAASDEIAHGKVDTRQVLGSWQAVIDYCRAAMGFAAKEEFRVLFLDKRNGLIRDEVMQRGTVDHTPVYPREVIKRALDVNATALVLVHNHPTGDPAPSDADIRMTNTIVEIARPMGIVIHDHIIVGKRDHASFKALGLL